MSHKKVLKTIDKYQILCYTKSINNMNILIDTKYKSEMNQNPIRKE